MKKINLYTITAILAMLTVGAVVCPARVAAQVRIFKPAPLRVESDRTSLDEVSGMVNTEMILDFNNMPVPKRSQLRVTPYLMKGDRVKLLPAVILNGTIRDRLIDREHALTGSPDSTYFKEVARKTYTGRMEYRAEYSMELWMNGSQLILLVEECGCAGETHIVSNDLVDANITLLERLAPVEYTAEVYFIIPEREEIKRRFESGEAHVIYQVGRSDVRIDLGNNRAELDKILNSIAVVRDEPTASISNITIRSYASPEGTWESNMRLSEKRAASIAQWLRNNSSLSDVRITSLGLGEDWDRLDTLVATDPVLTAGDKDYVRGLIRNVGVFEGRESRLMAHNGGATYRYLLHNVFPALRRSHYHIEYTIPEFTLEKSMQVYKTRPGLLSLAELNAIANLYEKGSDEFNNVFGVASRLYPDDKTASLNAAAAELASGNIAIAKEMLNKFREEPWAWINLGNIAAMEGEYDTAADYFRRAKSAGMAEADKYIEYLSVYRLEREAYKKNVELWKQAELD